MRGNESSRAGSPAADPGSLNKQDRVEPPRRVYREPEEAGPPLGQRELFLGEVESSGQVPAGASVKEASQAVLCTLTQWLEGRVAADLTHALPEDIAALLRVCPRHIDDPGERLNKASFLDVVAAHMDISLTEAQRLSTVVFSALRMFLQSGEEQHIRNSLPDDIGELWRTP